MAISLIIVFLILLLGFAYSLNEDNINSDSNRRKYITSVCFILVLHSGLRNVGIGADTFAYYSQFEDIKLQTWNNIFSKVVDHYYLGIGKDPGYLVFQKVIQYVLPNFQLFLVFIAVFFFSALGIFIYKNTTRLNDSILAFVMYSSLFFTFFSLTGIRQTIATGATLIAYEFIKKRNFLIFLMIILIASTIHRSCLAFLPFYFIVNIKNSKLILIGTILMFPILMKYKDAFNSIMINIGDYKEFVRYEGAGTITFTIMLLLVALVALWRINRVLPLNNQSRHFYIAFALAIFFTPLTWVNPSAMRIVQYFSIFMLLLIPLLIQSFEFESLKVKRFAFGISIMVLIFLLMKSNWDTTYKFFWQDMPLSLL